jgi:septal ring factor EnvC (AmiA/AmiB activator)
MKRVFAGALTLVLCCATWLAAADSDQKKPVSKQAAANSARQFKQMQAQLKQQQEQIAKLLAQLDQNRKALEEAQQKVGASAQQTQQQAVATEQKANSLNDQLMGMQSAGGVVDEKPHNK